MDHRFSRHKKGLNIVIVGCGKVGLSLVDKLSKENHDITIIDRELQPTSFAQSSKGKIARQLIAFIADRVKRA